MTHPVRAPQVPQRSGRGGGHLGADLAGVAWPGAHHDGFGDAVAVAARAQCGPVGVGIGDAVVPLARGVPEMVDDRVARAAQEAVGAPVGVQARERRSHAGGLGEGGVVRAAAGEVEGVGAGAGRGSAVQVQHRCARRLHQHRDPAATTAAASAAATPDRRFTVIRT
ncbi:MAG: hypothetical protein ACT4RN_13330 [Pseudonocardia sp.]